MLLGRREGDVAYDFSKNTAIGTGSTNQQQLSKAETLVPPFPVTPLILERSLRLFPLERMG
jgi:hypothetical protein